MNNIRRIIGPTILLGSGGYFDFENPDGSPLDIEDVAYGLGFACRFAGQCRETATGRRVFYSVAEHCIRMSKMVPAEHAYDALMHELGEGTCGDMPSPLKSICPDYKVVEKRCEASALRRFKVPMRDPALIKHFDMVMLATERRDLMAGWKGETWTPDAVNVVAPHGEVIKPWAPEVAASAFLIRYRALAPADAPR